MKKMLKLMIIIVIITIVAIPIKSSIATEEVDCKIILESEDKIEAGKEVTVNVKIAELKSSVDTIIGVLEYNKDIFEQVVEDDMEPVGKWNYPACNMEDLIFMIDRAEPTENDEIIMKIELKVKENVTVSTTTIKLTNIEVAGLGEDLKANTEVELKLGESEEPEKPEEPEEKDKLYLSTEKYKIGDNNIKDYENGDKYISRVTKETKLKDYKANLKTNGTIKVLKEDKTELTEEEYVGTGMTLIVTKDEEKIELKIAVMGDLDGNGKITATDLSTLNQNILKLITLENEYKIAGDLDENNKITATDLSTLNQMLLKII